MSLHMLVDVSVTTLASYTLFMARHVIFSHQRPTIKLTDGGKIARLAIRRTGGGSNQHWIILNGNSKISHEPFQPRSQRIFPGERGWSPSATFVETKK